MKMPKWIHHHYFFRHSHQAHAANQHFRVRSAAGERLSALGRGG
jgi:hypothetical protein